jgi:hypothetical protein
MKGLIGWDGRVCSTHKGYAYHILIGKSENERPFGRPMNSPENVIKIDLKEIRCECANWIEFVQDGMKWLEVLNTVIVIRGSLQVVEILGQLNGLVTFWHTYVCEYWTSAVVYNRKQMHNDDIQCNTNLKFLLLMPQLRSRKDTT